MGSDKPQVLILSPHTDDGELGCGASIARLKREGAEVNYVAFSYLPEFENGVLAEECRRSAEVLGMDEWLLNYPVRRFHEFRQEILDVLINLNKEHSFDMVFAPSKFDVHQDHEVLCREAARAFKHATILGYEEPWNNYAFEHNYFIKVTEEDVMQKVTAIAQYQSQRQRTYTKPEYIRALAMTRGIQINADFAEAFHIVRGVL